MINLYNTLTRKKEAFKPLKPPHVGLYSCGPTVYLYAHIGNFRTYLFEDWLRRVLEYNQYQVKQVMNITDVGHLTGDNLGDADLGEDRMEKAALSEERTVEEIAQFYTKAYLRDMRRLSIQPPHHLPKATDHIQEQIKLVQKLEQQGLAYQTRTGVYFDTQTYQRKGYDYAALAGQELEDKAAGVREEVVVDPDKKNPADFGLWFFTVERFADHIMRWDSPWAPPESRGKVQGFPGWHVECSAMSKKYLGQPFDIHTGGEDHIALHHTNELAQSMGAYGKPLAKYWLHGRFMTVEGRRMGKSEGNAYLVEDLIKRGFDPLAFRYLCLQTHYRKRLNFSWEALAAAQAALGRLRREVSNYRIRMSKEEKGKWSGRCAEYEQKFLATVNDDLAMPKALSIVWDLLKSDYPARLKLPTLLKFDEVLGLRLREVKLEQIEVPNDVRDLADKRAQLRQQGKFEQADELRVQIQRLGFIVEDTPEGAQFKLDKPGGWSNR